MQTIRNGAALVASFALLVILAPIAVGQQPAANPRVAPNPGVAPRPQAPGGLGMNGIAVIDIAYIFKTYPKFDQQMQMMRGKVEAAEAEVRKEQEAMKQMAEKLNTFQKHSNEYRQMEEALFRKQGDLQLKVSLQKKEFLEQEGKIYFTISQEIDDAVKRIAMHKNIVLVLRFAGDQVDPNDRNEILRGINKSIVYHHPQMDITPYVLAELQRGGGVSAAPNYSNPPQRPQ